MSEGQNQGQSQSQGPSPEPGSSSASLSVHYTTLSSSFRETSVRGSSSSPSTPRPSSHMTRSRVTTSSPAQPCTAQSPRSGRAASTSLASSQYDSARSAGSLRRDGLLLRHSPPPAPVAQACLPAPPYLCFTPSSAPLPLVHPRPHGTLWVLSEVLGHVHLYPPDRASRSSSSPPRASWHLPRYFLVISYHVENVSPLHPRVTLQDAPLITATSFGRSGTSVWSVLPHVQEALLVGVTG